MNYQHAYHAGNIADVVKHITLSLTLDYFLKKESGFCYIDTHAGEGLYDLAREEVHKTGEVKEGVFSLLKCPPIPLLQPYLTAIGADSPLIHYPGSPFIARHFLREQDQMILNELHPSAFAMLKHLFRREGHVHLHQRNAYEFLPAVLPPDLKRAVILIDPPFEKSSELTDIREVLDKSLKRFSQGCYLVWFALTESYPSLLQDKKMLRSFTDKYIAFDFVFKNPPYTDQGLIGCSMVIVNPPFTLAAQLTKVLPFLWDVFSPQKQGYWRLNNSQK